MIRDCRCGEVFDDRDRDEADMHRRCYRIDELEDAQLEWREGEWR